MRLPRMRAVRPIVVTLALLSCTENGPVGPQLDASARLNAAGSSQSVVISQVYGGGGNANAQYKNDFIEIFNNGNDAVNLAGWSVQYGSAANNFSLSTNLSGTIQPGKYLLVQEAAGTGVAPANPTPDFTGTINMSATDGKVALVRSTTLLACGAAATPCTSFSGTIADLVGFGSSTAFEGSAAVAVLSNTTAAMRVGSGCTDTNQNSADFTRPAPSPRNSATAANVCGGAVVPVDHVTVAPVPPATGTVAVGATVQFKATVFDAANNDITSSNSVAWSTSPTGFATVDANGLATGTAVGNTSVVATSGGKSGSSALAVTPAAPVENGDVVISQIYGGGGNSGAQYTNDYIELLNKGDNPVNLTGWSVQYGSATGSSFLVHALSGTIQPGHYFLIQEASTAAVGAALPAADLSDGLNLSGTSGKVILARTTTAQNTACPTALVVDMVGYGSSANCSAPTDWKGSTATLANTTAAFRKGDGCTNTGNAASDFTVAAPTPRNSASPVKRCAAATPPPSVHFSELHYDNAGTDVNEKIEIAGPAGTDLTGWSVVLYGGDAVPDFSAYSTTDLGVTIPATCGANGVIVIDYAVNGIKNAKFNGVGNPAGMALIDNNGQVVEFLSYEGAFTALDGPAAGHLSVDIGVAEEPPPAPGNSLHRDDLGVWQPAAPQDFGACNAVNATPPPPSASITFSGRLPTDQPLPVGFESQLFPTEKNASGVTVSTTFTWSSDTPGIATVDADGVIRGVSQGTATFRARAQDGTQATYSLPIAALSLSTSADWSGNLEFGTPTDANPADDHIITHSQFTSSYSLARKIPNWVSAKLDVSHYGSGSDRCNCFTWDPAVGDSASQYYTTNAYTGVGSVWNRGHLLRSADVEATPSDNAIAYYFSNIAPQSAQMNQGPWAVEENFLGDLAKTGGRDVYEIMGVSGSQGTLKGLAGAPVIPQWFWKVAVIVPHGRKLADIRRDDDLQVIAVVMPNIANVNSDWTTYKVTTDSVEKLSGYDLLNALPLDIQAVVESNDQPPVAVMSGPATGNEGSALTFSGSGSSDPDAGDVLSYSWNFGDNTTATGVSPTHLFADNGQYIVTLTVSDQIGAKRSTTQVVTINNVAPSGVFASPAPVNEGSSFTLSINNATDPSSADMAAGLSYRFDCGTGFGSWTSSSSFSCVATDNPGGSVAAEVQDKDGGVAHYSGAVVINNVAPTAVFSNNGPRDEGTGFTLRLDGVVDPGPADVAAGFQYRFDCGNGPGAWQFSPSAFCPAADNGTFSVSGEVKDKDGASTIYNSAVVVNNVAPTADFTNNGPVNEGSSYTLTLANGTDVSSVDVAAGLQYRFDCGTGFGSWGSSPSASCPAPNHGTFNVAGEIRDKDLGVSSYAGSVTVNNVAPTAVFLYTGTVSEGTPFTLKMNNGTDSPADMAAGLEYRFDCGAGFGGWGSSTTVTCPTVDNGDAAVGGEVRDRQGAASAYSGTVSITSVAPTGTFSSAVSVNEGSTYNLTITDATDPSSADVAAGFNYRFDCGAGFGAWGSSNTVSCEAADNPGNVTRGEIRDKDGAVTAYDGTVTISNVAPTASFSNSGPVNEGSTFTLTLANGTDASAIDLAAGLQYRFNCGSGFAGWSASNTITCNAPNHGTYAVGGEVRDKDGGFSSYSGSAIVVNVAPTAVFTYPATAVEGATYTLTASNGLDSPADLAAGLEYRFNCGSGFGDWSAAVTRTCVAPDNGSFAIVTEVRDQGHAFTSYSGTIAVSNVAPTGTFSTSAPANEGSSFTIGIAGGTDASPADVAAGFTYRFDCGTGFGSWSSASSAVCQAIDNPGVTTRGEIRDKDAGISTYSAFSAVNNVAPSVHVDPAGSITSGGTYSIAAGFMDAGQNDGPWTYVINWGDGNSASSTNVQGAIAGSHQYFIAGTYTVTLTVKDKDGAVGSASTTLQVGRVAGSMDVNPNQVNIGNNGNGTVTVTVFGNSQFNAGAITTSSVRIGHTAPDTEGNGSAKVSVSDVNHDGILDLVAKFTRGTLVSNGDITANSTQLSLDATLNDGRQIRATGAVSVKN
ncbi:MAG: lamin tail domain-containing protein [Gemmatimonadota bacterium]|nr:lamin tail domain-containing protein [Gemmatimonadota bacterium]